MNTEEISKITGFGIVFPIKVDNGKLATTYGVDLINSNLRILLTWPRLTKLFNSDYGTIIHKLLEEPNDIITRNLIECTITEAISKYYPIVEVNRFEYTISEFSSKLSIKIYYSVKDTDIDSSINLNYENI